MKGERLLSNSIFLAAIFILTGTGRNEKSKGSRITMWHLRVEKEKNT